MIAPLRLIKRDTPVWPGLPARGRTPNIGVVYATSAGDLGSFPGWRPMTYREQFRTRYRRRYDVDMSDQHRKALMMTTPLPARGDYYYFFATVEVRFRVHDPEEIVRRNLSNAIHVVYAHLADEFRRITRKHDIEDSELAESEIIRRFAGPDVLDDGITVFYVGVRLLPDEKATRYLQRRKEAERRVHVGRAEHKVELEAAVHRGELDRLNREFEREMAEVELHRMEGRVLDAYEIVRHHLARHPGDTTGAMELMVQHRKAWMEHQEQYNKRTTELFESMVNSNLVQAADMERLMPEMLGQLGIVRTPVPVESSVGEWDEPPVHSRDEPAAVTDRAVQPVYLVLDESAAADTVVPHLTYRLPRMLAAIAADEAASEIRLAVLGFARHLTERLKFGELTTTFAAPEFSVGAEAAYPVLFSSLADRIDADLAELQRGHVVKTPLVYVLCASTTDEDWATARRRLTDPELRAYPPEIVAFGIGDATPQMVAAIATEHHAYFVLPDADPGIAIQHFAEFTVRDLLDRVHRTEAGDSPPVRPPDSFSRAIPSPADSGPTAVEGP